MQKTITITRHITKAEEKQYLAIPFEVPADVARIDLRYEYTRHFKTSRQDCVETKEVNIIDLALNSPDGFVGASGSNRMHIWVSEHEASRGYMPVAAKEGEWSVIAGAYHVAQDGVDVCYDITFTFKERVLLKGDLHIHSVASDGHMTPAELMELAALCRLDFIAISDHNAFSQNHEISRPPKGLTVIPGIELTHYNGHCNFLGVKQPVESPFCLNSRDEMFARMKQASENGALISVNHPFADCDWRWDLEKTEFDTVELWNGATPFHQNRMCLEWWHKKLEEGFRIPIVGGSDFHSPEALRSLASPTTWVYSDSPGQSDIIEALRRGRSFLTLNHTGTTMSANAEGVELGGVATGASHVTATFFGLEKGDEIHAITHNDVFRFPCAEAMASRILEVPAQDAKFMRFELYKPIFSGFANFPYLISNPIYF